MKRQRHCEATPQNHRNTAKGTAKHANLEKKFTQEFEKKKEEVQPRNYYITD